jgi:GT2 family glycosyltransferase
MISIIICSRSGSLNQALKNNIEETIGILHEVILIDNSANNYSIFQAYNKGVKQSQFPYLCFMHDDIVYHTKKWGDKVIKHFEDKKTGAIGIAGSPYAAYLPGSWWAAGLVNEIIIPKDSADLKPIAKYFPGENPDKNPVVVLDGVWMCIRKSLFGKIWFDETNFTGFHFYDVDISLQLNELGYKLYCVFDILMQHFSSGNMDKTWLVNTLLMQKKWARHLPVQCITLSYTKRCEIELKTLGEYLDILLINKWPKGSVYKLMLTEFFKFSKGYFYYKSPVYFFKYLYKIFKYGKKRTNL